MIINQIKKLISHYCENYPIEYYLPVGEEKISLNPLIGRVISLEFLREITCIQCNRITVKSFQQGYCYLCYRKLMDCNLCIIHPERCKHPQENCPDTWEHQHCKQDHIVYLSNSSGIKVGITRSVQTLTRWVDQGAIQAITLFKVGNRQHSGILETVFKKYVADKTNWRRMLTQNFTFFDMVAVKKNLLKEAENEIFKISQQINLQKLKEKTLNLTYPILDYPEKLKAFSLDKEFLIKGKLIGIKGQYLLLENGVINIRKHAGYKVKFTVSD